MGMFADEFEGQSEGIAGFAARSITPRLEKGAVSAVFA